MDSQIMDRLSQKIEQMLRKIASQKDEIEPLRLEVSKLRAENESKQQQISNLYESIGLQKTNIEELFSRIEEGLR